MGEPRPFKEEVKKTSSSILEGPGEGVDLNEVGVFVLEEVGEKRLRNADFVSHISSQPDFRSREIRWGFGLVGGIDIDSGLGEVL